MTWTVLPVLLLLVGFGMAILPAFRHDQEDAAEDMRHMLRHPNSNCPECEES